MSTPATPTLPLKLPDGTDLPPRPSELWREHTGARLADRYPEAHAMALDLMRKGETVADVARIIAKELGRPGEGSADGLRKIVRGWGIEARIDRTEIRRIKAAFLAEESIDKATELLDKATARDLGAVAMTFTQAHQMERNLGGLPSEIKVTTKLTLADLERMATQATTPPTRDVIDVTELPTNEKAQQPRERQ